jgi:hypothetical protein
MVSFGKSVAELSVDHVVVPLVSRQNKYLASFGPGDEDALNGSSF